jgi:uncharacterized membrane protein
MMIGMVLFWLAIILGVVWLVRDGIERQQPAQPRETALALLDRRFAEGAISLDEYTQRRDVLTDAAAHWTTHATCTKRISKTRSWRP